MIVLENIRYDVPEETKVVKDQPYTEKPIITSVQPSKVFHKPSNSNTRSWTAY